MNKPNVTIALVRQILNFGRFETDLAALDKAAQRYGRRGWTDKRVGGKRIKLLALLSDPASQYLQEALVGLFETNVVIKQFNWVTHQWRHARVVTAIYVK